MHDNIYLHSGIIGNEIGVKFWEYISKEHKIKPDGKYEGKNPNFELERIHSHYNEKKDGRYIPRTLLYDMNPNAIQKVRKYPYGSLFDPNFIHFGECYEQNFAVGHYTEGPQILEISGEQLRKLIEANDNATVINNFNYLAEAATSGMNTMFFNRIREEFPEVLLFNEEILSKIMSQNIGLDLVIESEEIQNYISQTLTNITCSNRFSCGEMGSTSYNKIFESLTPFPRIHFLIVNHYPQPPYYDLYDLNTPPQPTPSQIHAKLFDSTLSNMTISKPREYLTSAVFFRGYPHQDYFDLNYLPTKISKKKELGLKSKSHISNSNNPLLKSSFAPWIPYNNQNIICPIGPALPNLNIAHSATLIGNNGGVSSLFKQYLEGFSQMFRRKAFLHWYTGLGMDELEFTEAESNVLDLIGEYETYVKKKF